MRAPRRTRGGNPAGGSCTHWRVREKGTPSTRAQACRSSKSASPAPTENSMKVSPNKPVPHAQRAGASSPGEKGAASLVRSIKQTVATARRGAQA